MAPPRAGWLPALIVVGFVCLLTASAVMLVNQEMDAWTYGLGGLGVFCFVVFGIVRPWPRLAAILARVGVAIGVLLVTVIVLNLLASRFFLRLDLTELRGYSLAPQTIEVLSKLKESVAVTGFFRATDYRTQLADKLLGEYADHSPWITYEAIDPELRPSAMQAKGISRDGTLLFEQGTKRQEVSSVDEQSITSALLHLSGSRQTVVYFLTGNGERDIDGAQRTGYNVLKWHLENKSYVVKTLDLKAAKTIPPEVDVLVIASPQTPFSKEDQTTIGKFLLDGHKLLMLLDAGLADPCPDLLAEWGVQTYDDMVFDPASAFFGDAATPMVARFPASPITRGLDGTNTFFPIVREVKPAATIPEGLSVTSLALSSDRSWGEMNLSNPQASFDPATDHAGPISLAVSVQGSLGAGRGAAAAGARAIIFGDSDFVSNAALSSTDANLGNASLFINAVNWAVEDEALIRLSTIGTEARHVILSGQQMRLVGYVTMLFVPLLVLFAGVFVYWRQHA